MEQRSSEWHKMRRNYIGASDAPIIMGVSPYKSVAELWKEKVGLSQPRSATGAMLYGIRFESQALESFQSETGLSMKPRVVYHESISYMMASLDGITDDQDLAVEIKCAGKKDHAIALEGIIPLKYYPQLQHQIEVAKLDKIYYYSYNISHQDNEVPIISTSLITVTRNDEYIKLLLEKEKQFWKCVEEYIEIE